MKRLIIILVIAIIHLGSVVGLALSTFDISGFIFGVYPAPRDGTIHDILTTAYNVLMFPLGLVADSLSVSARFLEWPLLVLNSLLWAVVVYLLIGRWLPPKRR